jgi:hypothetical protein
MKTLISPPYIFTPGASGVGTIQTNIKDFNIKSLLAIINVTRETIIYSGALVNKGYTNLSETTITLEFDTSIHSSTDILQIFYDSTVDYPAIVNSPTTDNLLATLQMLIGICETLQVVDSAQRQRIAIDAIATGLTLATVTTVGTVNTVSSVTNVAAQSSMAGMDREMYINIAEQTYAQCIRQNLKFQ